MKTILQEAVWRARQWRHGRAAARVLATTPRTPRDDGVVLFSMIGTRVLAPYLVAAKSLHHHLGRGRFVILDDGSLTAADKAVLAHHLGNPRVLHIGDIDTAPAPVGGTWERLLTLLDLRAHDYIIQLDSDTVTLGPVPEVAAAIDVGRSFTIYGDALGERLGVLAAADFVTAHPAAENPDAADHVQARSEAVLDRIAMPGLRYVRGCAAFAGFAPSIDGRARALEFSQQVEALIGRAKWSEWGSEQVTSNMIVASHPDPAPLPYARYLNFWNRPVDPEAAFVHFIGTYRHHGRAYLDATKAAIAALG